MRERWRDVFYSVLDSLFHRWKENGDDVTKEVIEAFDLQDQSETDEIDLEHYLETKGC